MVSDALKNYFLLIISMNIFSSGFYDETLMNGVQDLKEDEEGYLRHPEDDARVDRVNHNHASCIRYSFYFF